MVINSRLGLDTVAQFGRVLSQFARLCCAYFSMGVDGLGAPYGTRFPRRTLPHALALTDNAPMAATLRRLHGDIPGQGVAVLAARLDPAPDEAFAARLSARLARLDSRDGPLHRPLHWAWVSRIERFKGTATLAALARLRPDDRFDVFGPLQDSLEALGLMLPNITHRGILPDVAAADFSKHDGFLFTSLFEGMPNIVLEMSQHAIPMVLADVGGLRETLTDASALFVPQGPDAQAAAAAFSAALDRAARLTTEECAAMIELARARVAQCHSPAAHAGGVAALFGDR